MEEEEVKAIRKDLERFFRVYDIEWDETGAMFYVSLSKGNIKRFNELQQMLAGRGYVSGLKKIRGEDVIVVGRKPKRVERKPVLNVILLILTLITTVWAGSIMWMAGYGEGDTLADTLSPGNLGGGALFFALPLMTILGCHEMGHYLMAKRYGMNASLPYFIPAPPPIIFGTFGAFISIRDPMPNRKALFDIGVAGPIAGFIVAIPVILIGLALSSGDPGEIEESGDVLIINLPLLYVFLSAIVPPSGTVMHPTAFAGWVGLLVTAMNLLPVGQLDGGHVARALFKDNAKYASYFAVFVLLILGFFFTGWLVFALLILFLGIRHPPPLDDITELDPKRKMMGFAVLAILLLSFVPIPLETSYYEAPEHSITVGEFQSIGVAVPGGNWTYSLPLINSGNQDELVSISVNTSLGHIIENTTFDLKDGIEMTVNITFHVPANSSIGDTHTPVVTFTTEEDAEAKAELTLLVGDVSLEVSSLRSIPQWNFAWINLTLNDLSDPVAGSVLLTVEAPNSTFNLRTSTNIILAQPIDNATIASGSYFLEFGSGIPGTKTVNMTVASTSTDFSFSYSFEVEVAKG